MNGGARIVNPAYDFHDRVVVITGAGSGMGLATAQAFAESGAAVVLAGHHEHSLRTATAELTPQATRRWTSGAT